MKVNWQENQDSSMVERQARDLEVRVQIPVQVRIFHLKFNKIYCIEGKVSYLRSGEDDFALFLLTACDNH